jgi:hypothetical protein
MSGSGDIYAGVIDGSDQLDPADSLTGQIGEDPLDAGYSPPDREPIATRWGNTVDELLRGESLAAHLAEEEPEVSEQDLDEFDQEPRAGRLVAVAEDAQDDGELIGRDAGAAGWASSAEEAAIHISNP